MTVILCSLQTCLYFITFHSGFTYTFFKTPQGILEASQPIRALRRWWLPFQLPHAALGRWQASPHVPWSFFRSRHFCLLPPVDPQAAAGHGGRLLSSGSVWLLLAYRHPTLPIRCHQGSLLPVLDELPSESGLPSVKAGGGRACVIAEHAL